MLIVTPNLCLDITIRIARLIPGTIARSSHTETAAGSKGVNVARAARTLGAAPILAGFLPDDDGARFVTLLGREGTPLLPVAVPGVLRIASILLADDGQVTVINGRGPEVDESRWAAFVDTVTDGLTGQDVLICTGSLPPGVPDDAYRQLSRVARRAGLPVVVDAAPAVLAAALPALPDLVSPNLSEAEGLLFGRQGEQVHEEGDDIPGRAVKAATALHDAGAIRAVVTAGAAGAALVTRNGSWWLPAAPVRVINPIGAGDCFTAGAALALIRNEPDLAVVRRGMAVASASCETATAGLLLAARAAELFDQIEAVPI